MKILPFLVGYFDRDSFSFRSKRNSTSFGFITDWVKAKSYRRSLSFRGSL